MKKKSSPHGDLSWFTHDRFGMFIHWGLYSLPARHEWIRHRECISNEEYQRYFTRFEPDLFEPKAWAKAAKAAGMTYFVITTKHHEGFCLWDSQYTDYKAPNTPAGRDLVREIVDAFRAEGLHVGFYYSLLDWHHPDFPIDRLHPLRNLPQAEKDAINRKCKPGAYAEYMRNQITELLTNYGKIDVLWFDFSYPGEDGKGHEFWESEKMVRLIRKLQPQIILDNRLDLPGVGDIVTPEQCVPDTAPLDENGRPAVWEGCQTFSGSWGYHRDETSWKSPEQCIQLLINHVSRGGNLLMNVGPTSRGYLDSRAVDRLGVYAEWMKYHARSIRGCTQAPADYPEPRDCRYTFNPETKRLYLHFFAWPFSSVTLPKLAGKIEYAQLLDDGSELFFREQGEDLILCPPVLKPNAIVPVAELFLK